MNRPRIGAHVSAAGGVSQAFSRAQAIGAETIQIFGSSPRQWRVVFPSLSEQKKFLQEQQRTKVFPVFLHAPYLVNIASPNEYIYQRSIQSLAGHLKIAQSLKAEGVVFHIGSRRDLSDAEAVKKCAQAIKKIFSLVSSSFLIIENNAGEGKKFGVDLTQISAVLQAVNSPRLKVCLDTAHLFASGVLADFSFASLKKFFQEAEEKLGKEKLIVLHINDSLTPAGSRRDRHANIGEGKIGLRGFQNLAKIKQAQKVPWILETPGFHGQGPDQDNIKILHSLFT